jgi:opacity protein-like surface antigen
MKLKYTLTILALLVFSSSAAFAQDYKKWEFFGGYSALQFDNLGGDTNNPALDDVLGGKDNLRGLELSLTYNFHKYFGVKGDWSLHVREDNFSRPAGSGTIDSTVHNFLGAFRSRTTGKTDRSSSRSRTRYSDSPIRKLTWTARSW